MLLHFYGSDPFHPGSVYHLAERAGLKSGKRPKTLNLANLANLAGRLTPTRVHYYMKNESQLEEELEQMLNAKQEKWKLTETRLLLFYESDPFHPG